MGAMNIPKFAFAVACGLSGSAISPAFAEDLTIVYKATEAMVSAQYLSSMRTRRDRGPYRTSSNAVMGPYSDIVDMVLGKYITINHQKREYWEATPQEREAAAVLAQEKSNEARAKLKETYAKMGKEPPFEVDAQESASLEKLPDHRTIARYSCDHYVITLTHSLNDRVLSVTTYNYWVAPDLRDPSLVASDSFGSQTKIEGLGAEFVRLERKMNDQGVPLAFTLTTSGFAGSSEAIEVKKGPIDPSVFLVPAGYIKARMP